MTIKSAIVSSDQIIEALETRRSVPAASLQEPGPDTFQLKRILGLAARVPDHAMLEPWRFIVLAGEARRTASLELAEIYAAEKSDMEPSKLTKFKSIISRLFTYAPTVVLVVSSPRDHDQVPVSEQLLSAGALCMNILTGVHLMGYHGNWLTGWVTYSRGASAYFGLSEKETFAGVIQIGTAASIPPDRTRPSLETIVTYWHTPLEIVDREVDEDL